MTSPISHQTRSTSGKHCGRSIQLGTAWMSKISSASFAGFRGCRKRFSSRPVTPSGRYRAEQDSRGHEIAPAVEEAILMSFGIYLVGYIIMIVGLAIGAHLMRVP